MPDLSSPQRGNLAWLMSGLHEVSTCICPRLPSAALERPASRQDQASAPPLGQRGLTEAVDPRPLTEAIDPIASAAGQAASSDRHRKSKAHSYSHGHRRTLERQILMAALACRRRALPLRLRRRTVRRRTGVSSAEEQISLLQARRSPGRGGRRRGRSVSLD